MKTQAFFSALLTGISLVSAAPTPHKTVDKRVPQVTVTVIPIPLAPYPDSPYTNEFQYINYDDSKDEDKKTRTTIHNAFKDWPAMMQKALESIANSDDKTFDRWFPDDVDVPGKDQPIDARGYVSGVFRQLLQADATSPIPKEAIKNTVNDKNDFGKDGKGNCGATTKAYTRASTNTFHVCPAGLALPTAATDIDCSKLGDKISQDMRSLTATLVHEFMHLNAAGDSAPSSAGHIKDVVYNPSNCNRLRNAKSHVNQQKTFINADSYKWLAVNAYYNSACGKEFQDPEISTADFEEGMAETYESNEYDAALTDGIFAYV
ncbi:hypothetical protein Q7P36_008940 [Cladosporium allicinum]